MTFLQKVAQSKTAQTLLIKTHATSVANWVLQKKPLVKKIPKTDLLYRVTRVENLLTAQEIFEQEAYKPALSENPIRILDIGCNTGYFILYCAANAKGRIKGLAVDANADMVKETEWHLQKNNLEDIHSLHGAAGLPPGTKTTTFFLSDSNIASQIDDKPNPNVPSKARRKVTIQALDLTEEWEKRYQSAPIDLLKIDVEGFETELIKNCPALLQKAQTIALEIHHWSVDYQKTMHSLNELGFDAISEDKSNPHAALVVLRKRTKAA